MAAGTERNVMHEGHARRQRFSCQAICTCFVRGREYCLAHGVWQADAPVPRILTEEEILEIMESAEITNDPDSLDAPIGRLHSIRL